MSTEELLEKLRLLGPAFREANALMYEFSQMSEEDQREIVRRGLRDCDISPTLNTQQLVLQFVERDLENLNNYTKQGDN